MKKILKLNFISTTCFINAVDVKFIYEKEKFDNAYEESVKEKFKKYEEKLKVFKDKYNSCFKNYDNYCKVFDFFFESKKNIEKCIENIINDDNKIDNIGFIAELNDFLYKLNEKISSFKYKGNPINETIIDDFGEIIKKFPKGNEFVDIIILVLSIKNKFISAFENLEALKKTFIKDFLYDKYKLQDEIKNDLHHSIKLNIKYLDIKDSVYIYFNPYLVSNADTVINNRTNLEVEFTLNYKQKEYYDKKGYITSLDDKKYYELNNVIFKKGENIKNTIIKHNLSNLKSKFKSENNTYITLEDYIKSELMWIPNVERGIKYEERGNYFDINIVDGKLKIDVILKKYDSSYLEDFEINIKMKEVENKSTFIYLDIDSYKITDCKFYKSEEELKKYIQDMCIAKIEESIKNYKNEHKYKDFDKIFKNGKYESIIKNIFVYNIEKLKISGEEFIVRANVKIDYIDDIYVDTNSKRFFNKHFSKNGKLCFVHEENDFKSKYIVPLEEKLEKFSRKLKKIEELSKNVIDKFYLERLGLKLYIENKKKKINLKIEKCQNKLAILNFIFQIKGDEFFNSPTDDWTNIYKYINGETTITKEMFLNAIDSLTKDTSKIKNNLDYDFTKKVEDKIKDENIEKIKKPGSDNDEKKHIVIGESIKQLLNNCNTLSSSQIQTNLDTIISSYTTPNDENKEIIKKIKEKIEDKKKEEQKKKTEQDNGSTVDEVTTIKTKDKKGKCCTSCKRNK